MSFKENSKIYYGLDIGTDSVGWSTTNEKYELLRYKNNLMWGVSLFEAASLAEERRGHRTARRRLDRRQQRVALLGELFAKEILKTDPDFFLRLKESSLYPEDRTSKNVNTYFDDADFKDSDYFKMYPTVHHLIKELSESNKPHDVRLVYLACAFIVAHRGHFLNGADENNVQAVLDFDSSYCEFTDWFKSNDIEDNPFSESVKNEFSVILRKKIGITAKEREIKNLLFGNTKTPDCYKDEEYPIDIDVLIKFISGGKTNLAKLFRNPSYDELDIQTVEVGKADFADTIDLLASSMEDTDVPLLSAVKAMYDWSLLIDVLKGQKTISDAKVCEYEQHKSDLKALKYIVRKYLDRVQYDEIFRTAGEKPNYVSYSYNVTDVKLKQLPSNFKKKNSEEFCKYIKSKLEKIKPESDDEAVYNELIEKCNSKTLCPKQVTDENRVIPYQLYYHELSMILDKASAYLDFLNETEDGISVKQKILTLMKFRIPYFVGPLVKRNETDNVWIVRKAEGRIYPWNFENMVDFDKSEDGFIRRMTCKCTYLAGEDVLPKYSLLYSKYTVLNEINNIKVNGEKISPELKQDIFNELFMKTSRVTVKKITELLKRKGAFSEEKGDSLSGVDINIKSSLKSYLDFRRLLENGSLSENDVERIIERITVTTDKPRLVSWLKAEYSDLPAEDTNPMNFVKNADKHYTIKVKETLKHKVSRNGETAWNPETDFDTVKRMMSKNSVRYVRYCYKRKGGFFNQNPDRAGNPDLARLKKDLDPVKYGGYNSKSISCFSLIKCTGVGAVIIPVELLCEKRYFSDDSFASEYAYSVLKNALPAKNIAKISIDDISFPLKRRPIKINTLFEFDGYRVNIRSKDSYHYFTISSAMAAIYSKDTSDYIKAVSSYIDKSDKGSKFKPGEAFDVLSNLKVYDEIAKKCISEPFSKISKLAEAGKKMEEGRDKFAELSIIEQMKTLLLLVDILKTGRINTCNLKPVGGVESYHTERMSAILKNTKYSDIRIIDQSPTGLYEKKSDNLLEL